MRSFKNIFANRLDVKRQGINALIYFVARITRNVWWDIRYPQLVPPGHFYSAIPSRQDIREYLERIAKDPQSLIADVDLNESGQLALLRELADLYPQIPFVENIQPNHRFYFDNSAFCYPDAIFLFCLIAKLRPNHVIEIGSGFSSAALLDTADSLGFSTRFTFIEPYPDTLRKVLRNQDYSRIELRVQRVQELDVTLFDQLQANDILFIDSTHVLKAGSDLQYILFQVLPRLRDGVYIHFHDIFYPFEYPQEWLVRGLQWNEAYVLRALLGHNSRYRIVLFPSFLEQFHRASLSDTMPLCLKGTAGSLWICVVANP